MDISEIKSSVDEMGAEITSSKKSIAEKIEKLKADIQTLKDCIHQKDKEINELKKEREELVNLFTQIRSIMDLQSQTTLLDGLSDIEAEVQTIMSVAQSKGKSVSAGFNGDVSAPITSATTGDTAAETGEDSRELLDRVFASIQPKSAKAG